MRTNDRPAQDGVGDRRISSARAVTVSITVTGAPTNGMPGTGPGATSVAVAALAAHRVAVAGAATLHVERAPADDLDGPVLISSEDDSMRLRVIGDRRTLREPPITVPDNTDAMDRRSHRTRLVGRPGRRHLGPIALAGRNRTPVAKRAHGARTGAGTQSAFRGRKSVRITVTRTRAHGARGRKGRSGRTNRIAPARTGSKRRAGGGIGMAVTGILAQRAVITERGKSAAQTGTAADGSAGATTGAMRMTVTRAEPRRQADTGTFAPSIAVTGTLAPRVAVAVAAHGVAVAGTGAHGRTPAGTRTHGVGLSGAGDDQGGIVADQRDRPMPGIPPGAGRQLAGRPVAVHMDLDNRRVAVGTRDRRRGRQQRARIVKANIVAPDVTAGKDAVKPLAGHETAGTPTANQQLADQQPVMDCRRAPLLPALVFIGTVPEGIRHGSTIIAQAEGVAIGTPDIAPLHLLAQALTSHGPGLTPEKKLGGADCFLRPVLVEGSSGSMAGQSPETQAHGAAVVELAQLHGRKDAAGEPRERTKQTRRSERSAERKSTEDRGKRACAPGRHAGFDHQPGG